MTCAAPFSLTDSVDQLRDAANDAWERGDWRKAADLMAKAENHEPRAGALSGASGRPKRVRDRGPICLKCGALKTKRGITRTIMLGVPCWKEANSANIIALAKKNKRGALGEARTRSTANNRAYNAKYPEKRAAHRAVEIALRSGQLGRAPCVVCGAPEAQAHHDDYSRQLEVTWLCHTHHVDRHRRMRCDAVIFAGDAVDKP